MSIFLFIITIIKDSSISPQKSSSRHAVRSLETMICSYSGNPAFPRAVGHPGGAVRAGDALPGPPATGRAGALRGTVLAVDAGPLAPAPLGAHVGRHAVGGRRALAAGRLMGGGKAFRVKHVLN